MRKLILTSLIVLLAGSGFAQVGGGGVVNPDNPDRLLTSDNTWSGSNGFTGVITVPTASNNNNAASVAYVDAAIASPPTNTAVFGILYIHNGAVTNSVTPSDTYVQLEGWTSGESVGVTLSGSNIVIASDGTYGIGQFISLSDGNNKTLEAAIHVNGDHQNEGEWRRKLGTSGDVGSASGFSILTLNAGDIVDLRMKCIGSTADVLIEQAQFFVERISSVTSGTNWSQFPAQNNVNMGGLRITNQLMESWQAATVLVSMPTVTVSRLSIGSEVILTCTNPVTLEFDLASFPTNGAATIGMGIELGTNSLTAGTGVDTTTFDALTLSTTNMNDLIWRKGVNQVVFKVRP